MSLIPAPVKRDITFIQGADFHFPLRYKPAGGPVDWSGCRARWQLRAMPSDSATLMALDSDEAGSTLTLDPDGWINLRVSRAAVIDFDFGEAVHYLEITWSDGTTWPLIEGKATLRRGGCRP